MCNNEQEDVDMSVYRQKRVGSRSPDRTKRSKVEENSLVEAIVKLTGTEPRTSLQSYPPKVTEGRDRDLNPGARLHRPIGYQATSPRPQFDGLDHLWRITHI